MGGKEGKTNFVIRAPYFTTGNFGSLSREEKKARLGGARKIPKLPKGDSPILL